MTDLVVRPPTAPTFIDEWERQPGESPKAWQAFQVFRDMGEERGVYAVRNKAGFSTSYQQLQKWAERFRWIERAAAYDRMIDRKRQRAHIEEVEAMARRQVDIGRVLQERGLAWVKEQLESAEQREKALTSSTALRFIDKGVDLEREGLGLNDRDEAGDVNVQVNVLDGGTRVELFDKIDQMASNAQRVEVMMRERSGTITAQPEEIIDAELVEDDEE